MKNPVIGRVKSRLAKDIGEHAAYRIYLNLIDKIKQSASAFRGTKNVFYADFIDINDSWPNDKFSKFLQQGKNLGECMSNAIIAGLNQGHEKVVLIGSDIPNLDIDIINGAFQKLENMDVVFGPSTDGGYYLIGLKRNYPDLFEDIPWSTKKVLDATLKKCHKKHLSTYLLPPLTDIDTLGDIYLLDDKTRDLYLRIIEESERRNCPLRKRRNRF